MHNYWKTHSCHFECSTERCLGSFMKAHSTIVTSDQPKTNYLNQYMYSIKAFVVLTIEALTLTLICSSFFSNILKLLYCRFPSFISLFLGYTVRSMISLCFDLFLILKLSTRKSLKAFCLQCLCLQFYETALFSFNKIKSWWNDSERHLHFSQVGLWTASVVYALS